MHCPEDFLREQDRQPENICPHLRRIRPVLLKLIKVGMALVLVLLLQRCQRRVELLQYEAGGSLLETDDLAVLHPRADLFVYELSSMLHIQCLGAAIQIQVCAIIPRVQRQHIVRNHRDLSLARCQPCFLSSASEGALTNRALLLGASFLSLMLALDIPLRIKHVQFSGDTNSPFIPRLNGRPPLYPLGVVKTQF